ncbi:MAG: metal ABC transporter permease [Alphaproteobacteria bacterium]
MSTADFLTIDLPALLLGTLACLSCALLGNFLILRRQALLGDAISHVVLPGIVGGFIVAGSLYPPAILLGALVASLLAVALITLVRRVGRVEEGAAMGVVFTTLFAGGVVMLERADTRRVHLDVEHTLYGNLEGTIWLGPTRWADLLDPSTWESLPGEIKTLAIVTLIILVLIVLLFKELRLATFDAGLARALGFRPGLLDAGLMAAVAVAAVAAFQAVGSILVIAMFICPAACARMLTDRLSTQILLSMVFACLSGILGYGLGAFAPTFLGLREAVSASGMIAVVAGLLQTAAMLFAPRHGALVRMLAQRRSTRAEQGARA